MYVYVYMYRVFDRAEVKQRGGKVSVSFCLLLLPLLLDKYHNPTWALQYNITDEEGQGEKRRRVSTQSPGHFALPLHAKFTEGKRCAGERAS